jgi:outer membrane receptor for ferrienterochelin and colicins
MKHSYLAIALLLLSLFVQGQETKSDAHIFGHVVSKSSHEHLGFATVFIKGTTIGITTDETGHYRLLNLPPGKHIVRAQFLSHKPKEIEVEIKANQSLEVNFELEKDALNLNEVVITGNRNETSRRDASTIISTVSPKLMAITQSNTLGDGLNFSPGLRMENNCQNCGFSQVRMNGMEGPYSQILINSRPIFSGLAGVYGLELIPSAMIERVEVIRGGGSALYGSNAVAGTINLILKDPINNSYEFGYNTSVLGLGMRDSTNPAWDHVINFNTSIVSADNKTGMSLYGFYRNRTAFDANGDDFSEIALLQNTTLGGRFFHRFGKRSKLTLDFFNINEDRRGGNKFDLPEHEADIAESLKHKITTVALAWERYFRKYDKFSVYFSGQRVNRDSYYGAKKSLSDYGNTKDFTHTLGAQYYADFGASNLVFGAENITSTLMDVKLGYLDIENAITVNDSIVSIPHTENSIISDQYTNTSGIFAQYDYTFKRLKISAGLRFDNWIVHDNSNEDGDKSGQVISPRISLKYDIREYIQARASFSQGYRAPQIFDEDLHIESSGSRQVVHRNRDDLSQETSRSYMASLDFNKEFKSSYFGFLVEGFYTQLMNPFVNEIQEADENGVVIYQRQNSEEGAVIQGVNMELSYIPIEAIALKTGFTVQSSKYDEAQDFDEKRFFRTPNQYGYFTADYQVSKKLGASLTGNYTGSMLVPYFGLQLANPEAGELRKSESFFDLGFKLRYDIALNGATLRLYAGAKNIFNSYQSDFDYGVDRDPSLYLWTDEPKDALCGT